MIIEQPQQKQKERIPVLQPGVYESRLIRIIDLGTQPYDIQEQKDPQGKVVREKGIGHRRELILSFETPEELIPTGNFGGKPYIVSRRYAASLAQTSNLFKTLKTWQGEQFVTSGPVDLGVLLGKPALVTTALTKPLNGSQGGNLKLEAVQNVSRKTVVGDAVNPLIKFSLNRLDFNPDTFHMLDKWVQAVVMQSPEFQLVKDLLDETAPFEDE